jgi:hypothetical protein
MFPAIMLGLVFVFAEITYTISDHCSIRVDWITKLLIIPIIVEISLALFVQFCTFVYCVNVYLKSLLETPPPTSDLFEGAGGSANSVQSTRYPYRRAFARIRKVCPAPVVLTLGLDFAMASLGAMYGADIHWNAVFNRVLLTFATIHGGPRRLGAES